MRSSGQWQGAISVTLQNCSAISSSAIAKNLLSNMQVPIQRLRKQGPAGCTPAAKPPSRKRARQAAAGATALLGLFSFFVLAGPFAGITTMLPVRTSLVSEGSVSPGTPSLARQGRVLTTVGDMLPRHAMEQTSVLHSSGPDPGHTWRGNETEPALLMPTDLAAQEQALQQLKVRFEVVLTQAADVRVCCSRAPVDESV